MTAGARLEFLFGTISAKQAGAEKPWVQPDHSGCKLEAVSTQMETLIRNIDASTYRAARARAALEGRSVGDVVTTALRDYLARNPVEENPSALLDQPDESQDDERSGAHIDEVVFLYCI